jgi:putative ABC transport system permease protein
VATTLVVTSFILITTADLGFDRQNVMMLWYRRSLKEVATADRPAAAAAVRADLLDRAKSVPGVSNVAIANAGPPLSGDSLGARISIPGFGTTKGNDVESRAVSPDYFRVMGMQLIRGRLLQASDRAGAPLVMLINDDAARRFFPDRDPVGQVVTYRDQMTIVGVLKGVRFKGPEADVRPEVYTPLDQEPYHDVGVGSRDGPITVGGLLVRTTRDPRALAPAVREAIGPALGGEPDQTLTLFVDDYFRRLTAVRRFNAGLMATFGFIAVAIGAIGVYGTMAFLVAQQVRAIGLRMALGATPSDVTRSVLWNALQRVGLGVGIGLAGALAVSKVFASFIFGIRPTDPTVYVAVGGFLAVVGFAAALVPALRAARLDPLVALRHE